MSCAGGWLAESCDLCGVHERQCKVKRCQWLPNARFECVLQFGDGTEDLHGRVHVARVACARLEGQLGSLARELGGC